MFDVIMCEWCNWFHQQLLSNFPIGITLRPHGIPVTNSVSKTASYCCRDHISLTTAKSFSSLCMALWTIHPVQPCVDQSLSSMLLP